MIASVFLGSCLIALLGVVLWGAVDFFLDKFIEE